MRMAAIKKAFNDNAMHIAEVKKDNGASSYALKEETRLEGPVEYGEKPKHGGDKKSKTYIEMKTLAGNTRESWE